MLINQNPFYALLTAALVTAVLSACASKPPVSNPEALRAYEQINDPLEPWNRAMLQLDQGLDTAIFNPTIIVYEGLLPKQARRGLTNAIRNFRTPITLVNNLLQGEGTRAGVTLGRFLINSTAGLLGLFDIAKNWGMPYHSEDFGQTLAVWGLDEGPYLYVPILGPSSGRDIIGYALDQVGLDPAATIARADNPFWWQIAYFGTLTVDTKSRVGPTLEDLGASSIDYYAALRAAYRQNRSQAIQNGKTPLRQNYDESNDYEFDDYEFDDYEFDE